jgi:hypothetical protein
MRVCKNGFPSHRDATLYMPFSPIHPRPRPLRRPLPRTPWLPAQVLARASSPPPRRPIAPGPALRPPGRASPPRPRRRSPCLEGGGEEEREQGDAHAAPLRGGARTRRSPRRLWGQRRWTTRGRARDGGCRALPQVGVPDVRSRGCLT